MKFLVTAFACLFFSVLCYSQEKIPTPSGPLSAVEKQFVGKWKGSRAGYKWEIERKDDRTFEIVMTEPDFDDPKLLYKNYATGRWWIEEKIYKFEWEKWWGDEGDLGGIFAEKVDVVEADKVITLTEVDDEDPNNIEKRVEDFEMKEWNLKQTAKNSPPLPKNPE